MHFDTLPPAPFPSCPLTRKVDLCKKCYPTLMFEAKAAHIRSG